MKFKWFAVSALAFSLGASTGLATARASAQQGPPPPGYGQGGWDAPPQEFRDVQRQGFHDGIEGARRDFDNHRQPNVNNRDEFRHPRVEGGMRHEYREGFRRGYDTAMRHMMEERGGHHDRDDRDHHDDPH